MSGATPDDEALLDVWMHDNGLDPSDPDARTAAADTLGFAVYRLGVTIRAAGVTAASPTARRYAALHRRLASARRRALSRYLRRSP